MANSVTLEVILEGKNLKVVQKDMDKLTTSTNKSATAQERLTKTGKKHHKGAKGVAGATANGTKAFSKMRNEIGGGSSGLVGAYATLAANVFAATAVFYALRKAAQFESIIQGLERTGNAAGTNLPLIADNLKKITGAAITTRQAMESVAIGSSAGFDSTQLENLTKVAKGASIALGRDMSDSLDRLIRGAAKLEPEIVDELGIMVRLDDATADYAESLGKTAAQLTQNQRQQAFLNAINEQGLKKYGDIADNIDINAFDTLAAAFSDMATSLTTFLNKALIPIATFFSEHQGALLGVSILFASTISKQMVPALYGMADGLASAASAQAAQAKEGLKGLHTVSKGETAYSKYLAKVDAGTDTLEDAREGHHSLGLSIAQKERHLKTLTGEVGKAGTAMDIYSKEIDDVRRQQIALAQSMQLSQAALAKQTGATAVANFGNFQFKLGWQNLTLSVEQYKLSLVTAGVKTTLWGAIVNLAKLATYSFALSLKAVGAAAMSALGPLGLLWTVGTLIWDWYKENFMQPSEIEKRAKAYVDSLENIKAANDQLAQSHAEGSDLIIAKYKVAIGFINDTSTRMIKSAREEAAANKAAAIVKWNAAKEVAAQILVEAAALKTIGETQGVLSAAYTTQEAHVKRLVTKMNELDTAGTNLGKAAVYVDKNSASFKNLGATIKELEEQSETNVITKAYTDKLKELETSVLKGSLSQEKFNEALKAAGLEAKTAKGFVNSITGSFSLFAKELTKLQLKKTTPFDGLLQSSISLQNEFTELATKGGKMGEVLLGNLSSLVPGFEKAFGEGKGDEAINTYVTSLQEAVDTLKRFPSELKKIKTDQKIINGLAKFSVSASQEALKLRKDEITLREDEVAALETAKEASGVLGETELKILETKKAELRVLKAQNAEGIETTRIAITTAKLAKEVLGIENKLLGARRKGMDLARDLLKTEILIAKAKEPGTEDIKLTAQEELGIFLLQKKARQNLIQQETDMKSAMNEVEFTLLSLKFKLIAEQLAANEKLSEDDKKRLGGIQATLAKAESLNEKNIQTEGKLRLAQIELEHQTKLRNVRKEVLESTKGAKTVAESFLNLGKSLTINPKIEEANKAKIQSAIKEKEKTTIAAGEGKGEGGALDAKQKEAITAEITAAMTIPDPFANLNFAEKISVMVSAFAPLKAEFAKLGPEGELVVSMMVGLETMAAGFENTFNKIAEIMSETEMTSFASFKQAWTELGDPEKAEILSAAFSAVANSIGALAGIMASASRNTVAGIDREIAAEKKRDGKSKESLNKIRGLEAKKEAQKKKAFEQNKKMMMAQVIMSTAAAYMGIMAAEASSVGFLAPALAGIALVLGAAQLAIIAGTSYQGGGSSVGSSPSSSTTSVGQRKSSVDLATSKSASGENAYFRGSRGMGGPGDFVPTGAMMGAKYRNEGGPTTGYVVGEQGPELFMPDRPGTIIPNDEISSSSQNVNISINAIDSRGVEQVLVEQRGNIIGMIRDAANNIGEEFYEDIDTSIYTPESAGARLY
ncbi:MAG TPA: hypothetical protein DCW83_05830 [Saprospirales bacterium]|nr:hypothetical protein [Saprospirales bacterium]